MLLIEIDYKFLYYGNTKYDGDRYWPLWALKMVAIVQNGRQMTFQLATYAKIRIIAL